MDAMVMSFSAEEVIACPLSRERHACACGLTLNCRISFIHHVNRLPLYYYKDPDHFLADPVLNVDVRILHSIVGFNADPYLAFYLNADPNPDRGSQTRADPDLGQTLKSQKSNCL
jgi:hypothetical protein